MMQHPTKEHMDAETQRRTPDGLTKFCTLGFDKYVVNDMTTFHPVRELHEVAGAHIVTKLLYFDTKEAAEAYIEKVRESTPELASNLRALRVQLSLMYWNEPRPAQGAAQVDKKTEIAVTVPDELVDGVKSEPISDEESA